MIDNEFELRQYVYVSTDPDQHKRQVVGIKKCADEGVLYELQCGLSNSWHYECELSIEPDNVLKTI